ncbi:MAG TPA: DUF5677 domain-containing protein [candidate division Zixibacteria bacterium]|nr:DUF5677 domain-containing protein [candidate division Zixibacteria bacterium]
MSRAKLRRYLRLAHRLSKLAETIAETVQERLSRESRQLSIRDRVLIGLALKMYHSFHCILHDAKNERLEACHHLKTLLESYVYLQWVGADTTDTRATLVWARSVDEQRKHFKLSPRNAEMADVRIWEQALRDSTKGLESAWDHFQNTRLFALAKDANLSPWYVDIYRLACQPAHIADLLQFVPQPGEPISLKKPPTSLLWATVALDYALQTFCNLLLDAAKEYGLDDLGARLSKIKSQIDETRSSTL